MNNENYNYAAQMNHGRGLQPQQPHSSYQSGALTAQQQQRNLQNQYVTQQQPYHFGQSEEIYQEMQRQQISDGQRTAQRKQPTGVASFDASSVKTITRDGVPDNTIAFPQRRQQQQQMELQEDQQQIQQQQLEQKQPHELTTTGGVQEKFKGFLKQAKDTIPTSSKNLSGRNLGFQPTAAMIQRHEDSLVSGKRPLYQFQVSTFTLRLRYMNRY